MLLAREIHYRADWKIKSELKDLNLVQCTESNSIEKIKFPKFLNSQHVPKEFIENFKFTEFEKPFRYKINKDFLNPKKSIIDSWIFESIPYNLGIDSNLKKHFIPCILSQENISFYRIDYLKQRQVFRLRSVFKKPICQAMPASLGY